MKTAQYSKKQITEAICYWQRQLDTIDAIDLVFESIKKNDDMLNESMSDVFNKVKDKILKTINKPEDVKEFVKNHDEDVKNSDKPLLIKAWNILKKTLSAGIDGLQWIADHWKAILVLLVIVALATHGVWLNAFINMIKDTIIEFGKAYVQAGEKIANANIAAGGLGGWTGAGLGGGLR